jgi:hypothetical protein
MQISYCLREYSIKELVYSNSYFNFNNKYIHIFKSLSCAKKKKLLSFSFILVNNNFSYKLLTMNSFIHTLNRTRQISQTVRVTDKIVRTTIFLNHLRGISLQVHNSNGSHNIQQQRSRCIFSPHHCISI